MLAGLSGINSVSGPGMLDFESCQSLEKLVVDDEICGMVARLRRGIEPRDDFPSRPLFEELLRDGHLLIATHTRKHRKEQLRLSVAGHRARAARPLARGRRVDARPAGGGRGREAPRRLDAVAPPRRDEARPPGENGARRGGRGHGRPADGGELRQVVRFTKSEAQPTLEEVLGAEGLPAEDALAPRLRRLVDEALATYTALVEPRAVCEELTAEAFAAVLAPVVPVTSAELVVGRVVPRAQALALFVATLGEALPARIRRLFDEDALAEGYMLDAVASVGADLLSDRLAERFEASLGGRGLDASACCPTAPATAAGPPRGQKPLFAALHPGEIGVTLNDSCLMSPVKSVSGRPRRRSRRRPPLPSRLPVLPRVPDPRLRPANGLGPEETERDAMDTLDRIADALQQGDDAARRAARHRGLAAGHRRPARSFRRGSSPG